MDIVLTIGIGSYYFYHYYLQTELDKKYRIETESSYEDTKIGLGHDHGRN